MDAFFVLIHSKGRSSRDQDNVLAREEANTNSDTVLRVGWRALCSSREQTRRSVLDVKHNASTKHIFASC